MSFLWNLLGVVTAVLAVIYAYFKWNYQYWKRKNVPYFEPKIPFGTLGNPITEPLAKTLNQMYEQGKARGWKYCGAYAIVRPTLLLFDIELVKTILTKDFQYFTDRGIYVNEKDDPVGCHLFSLGGMKWRNLRAKLTPTFTSGKLKSMFQTLVDCGLVLESYIEENIKPEQPVSIKEVMSCFTIDVIGSCAFGLDCNSFKVPDSAFRRHGTTSLLITKARAIKLEFCQNFPNLARTLRLLNIPKENADFFRQVVKDTVSYREKNNVVRKDFLQLLMEISKGKGAQQNGHAVSGTDTSMTMDEMAAQCFIFFLAGFETSSSGMTFALFELAVHPKIQDKVRDEINTVLAKHGGKMTYDSLTEMKYMGQVIDETLRLHSPVRLLRRVCVKDYKMPGEDLIIEKGTHVFIPIGGIHYDEEFWANPKEFDPERFSDEKKKSMNQYTHLAFGHGPRVCIGERFGMMQMKVGLTCLLRKFRVTVDKKTKLPLKLAARSFVNSAEGGIWLNLEKI